MDAFLQCFQLVRVLLAPCVEVLCHLAGESRELRVLENRGFDRGLLDRKRGIARAAWMEESCFQIGAHVPIGFQRVDVGLGDAAAQMSLDVLPVLGLLAVDIAREVEVVVVLLDLGERHGARITRNIERLGKSIDNLVDILGAESVLRPVLHEALRGVDHEDAPARLSVLLVHHHNARGDARAIKEIGGQADDAFDVALADKVLADVGLGITAK